MEWNEKGSADQLRDEEAEGREKKADEGVGKRCRAQHPSMA